MRAVDVARRLGTRGRHARPRAHAGGRRRLGVGLGMLVALCLVVLIPLTQSGASASPSVSPSGCTQADPTAGCQGVVSALPGPSSPVTVNGQGQYANLAVTVNQTKNLINQAVSVSWKGGTQTVSNQPGTFDGDYLQIFECWGDQQSSDPPDPSDPGPLPSQCEAGGESPSSSNYPVTGPGYEYSRVVTQPGWSTYSPSTPLCTTDPSTDTEPCLDGNGLVVQPFQSVDGTVVKQQADYNYLANQAAPLPFWLNSYFSFSTTNEIDFAPTYGDGTGNQLFQVDTGLEAPGLGCGQSVEALPGGGTTTPQCWLVVVPRSTGSAENPTGGMGEPDRHPVVLQPCRLQLLDQRRLAADHRQRAGLSRRRQLGAVAVQPARLAPVQLHPEQRRSGPPEPHRSRLRLGGDVGVLRSDPHQ